MAFALTVAAFGVIYNNATSLLGLPGWAYVPANLAAGAGLLMAGCAAGLSWERLGLGRAGLGPGVRWGLLIAAAVAVALALSLLIPRAQPLLDDKRVTGIGGGVLAYRMLVRIPLGTALFEEVAFRGVLFGALSRIGSTVNAVVLSSLVFGIWHIGPTLQNLRINRPGTGGGAAAAAVALGVVATFLGGILFALLRIRTRGIVGPAIVHAAVNALGTGAAWLSQR